jgi:hypothetical protein
MRSLEYRAGVVAVIVGILILTALAPGIEAPLPEPKPAAQTRSPIGWSDDIRITYGKDHMWSDIAVEGNYVYVTYDNGTNDDVYFIRSMDSGMTWEPEIKLTSHATYTFNYPHIGCNGSNVYIVYERFGDCEVFFINSSDYGQTWGPMQMISNNDAYWSREPDIACLGDNVYVVWNHDKDPRAGSSEEIMFRNSSDGGKTWSPEQQLTPTDSAPSLDSSIAVNDTNIHISYANWTGGKFEAYYLRSIDGGNSWDSPKNISIINDGWNSEMTRITVSNSNVHMIWVDELNAGIIETYYRSSTDNGVTWGEKKLISLNDGAQSYPGGIAADGNNVHVTIDDFKDGPTYWLEIYYTNSSDNGNSWEAQSRLTTAEGDSEFSHLAINNNTLHVTWMDYRNGGTAADYEIYYKRSPDFPEPPPENPISITANWNCITLIGDEDGNPDTNTALKASDLAASIEGMGTNVYSMYKWTNGGWIGYARRDGTTGNIIGINGVGDYTLNNSQSYMLRTSGAATWDFPWTLFTEQPDWYITGGWNGINCARANESDSGDLLTNYSYMKAIANWTGGGWYVDLGPDADFTLRGYTSGLYDQDKNANGIFVKSSDYGTTYYVDGASHNYHIIGEWTEDIRLTHGKQHEEPDIAVEGNYVYVTYTNETNDEIYFKRSLDSGITWEDEQQLTSHSTYLYSIPRITTNGSNIYIVYGRFGDAEVSFINSSDYGETWGPIEMISDNEGEVSAAADIACWGDNIYVAWYDVTGGSKELIYRNSSDGGQTWWPEQQLTPTDGASSFHPFIAVNDSNIHITYVNYTGGKAEVYYLRSTDGGISWDTPKSISTINDGYTSELSRIAASNSKIHITWKDPENGIAYETYYRSSNDNGITWGEKKLIGVDDGIEATPTDIVAKGNTISITTADRKDVPTDKNQVYYISSNDSGQTCGDYTRMTYTDQHASGSSLSIDDNNYIHIVWADRRHGGASTDREIYYKRSPGF